VGEGVRGARSDGGGIDFELVFGDAAIRADAVFEQPAELFEFGWEHAQQYRFELWGIGVLRRVVGWWWRRRRWRELVALTPAAPPRRGRGELL
jgi:hypothetical protein